MCSQIARKPMKSGWRCRLPGIAEFDSNLSRRALRQLNGALGNALEDRLMLDPSQVHVALGKPRSRVMSTRSRDRDRLAGTGMAWCRQQGIEPVRRDPGNPALGSDGGRATGRTAGAQRWRAGAGPALSHRRLRRISRWMTAMRRRRRWRCNWRWPKRGGPEPCPASHWNPILPVDADAWSRSLELSAAVAKLQADPLPPALNLLQGPYASRRAAGWAGIDAGSAFRQAIDWRPV
jgi:hypothetical protein